MSLTDTLQKVQHLKKELEGLPVIKNSDEQRLLEKFRLEWNYNSNHIEGNTLTYGETMLLLVKGKTTGDHDIREYEEMQAHDLAIEMVRQWAKDGSRPLTEADVRELNRVILVRPFYSPAITADGQKTQKRIIPGVYKDQPNHVRLPNGSIFRYAEPDEVPVKMEELISWYNSEKTATANPIVVAAKLHHDFVLIHPFGDGNGRVARLVMNYHLLKNGYPPVVVKSSEKKDYLTALAKADAGDLESFADYLGQQMIWSLELTIAATKGKAIDEKEDWEKKLALIERKLKGDEVEMPLKSNELIYARYQDSIKPLFEMLEEKLKRFDRFFSLNKSRRLYSTHSGSFTVNLPHQFDSTISKMNDKEKLSDVTKIYLEHKWEGLKRENTVIFNMNFDIKVDVENRFQYRIIPSLGNFTIEKRYNQPLELKEIETLVSKVGNILFEKLEKELSSKE